MKIETGQVRDNRLAFILSVASDALPTRAKRFDQPKVYRGFRV
jgi:hypothetical protein